MRNKRMGTILVIVLSYFFFVGVLRVKADWVEKERDHDEIEVSAGSGFIQTFSAPAGYIRRTVFRVTSGNDISFYITDEENKQRWKDDERFSAYVVREKVGSAQIDFEITKERANQKFCAIFSNKYSILTSKHVSVDIIWLKWVEPYIEGTWSVSPKQIEVGGSATVTVNYENQGEVSARDVQFKFSGVGGFIGLPHTEYIGTIDPEDPVRKIEFQIVSTRTGDFILYIEITGTNIETIIDDTKISVVAKMTTPYTTEQEMGDPQYGPIYTRPSGRDTGSDTFEDIFPLLLVFGVILAAVLIVQGTRKKEPSTPKPEETVPPSVTQEAPKPPMRFCSACGEEMRSANKFCPFCGAAI